MRAPTNLLDHIVEDGTGGIDGCRGDRQRRSRLKRPKEARLNLMKQAAACQWIHALQRFWLLEGTKAVNRREHELIGTRTEQLKRRCRVRARAQTLPGERVACVRLNAGQTVVRRPATLSARPPVNNRSAQTLVQLQQVMRMPLDRVRVRFVEQPPQDGEVVLLIVDRLVGR